MDTKLQLAAKRVVRYTQPRFEQDPDRFAVEVDTLLRRRL
jgi:hypothetical protein